MKNKLTELIKNKRVLYIATKNKDYIRISQEIRIVEEHASGYKIIVSGNSNYAVRFLYVFLKLLFEPISQYDVVIVGFMPQMIIPIFNKKFKGKILIVDFFISIADTLIDDRKIIKHGSHLSKVIKKIDKYTIKAADYVIVDTKAHGRYFCKAFLVNPRRILLLYLEADVSFYHPMNIRKSRALKNKMVVLYFGSILPVQGVEIILETIEQLKANKGIHFIMIGPIPKRYRKVISDTVTYYEWLSQKELAKQIACADLCLAGHFSSNIGKANRTIPGKVYIYQAMNKPIVLGESDANRELFEESESCYYVERGNPGKLKELIEYIYEKNMIVGE